MHIYGQKLSSKVIRLESFDNYFSTIKNYQQLVLIADQSKINGRQYRTQNEGREK